MARKGGVGTSSRNSRAHRDTGAELYLLEGSALPAGLGLSLFLFALVNTWAVLFCQKPPRISDVG